MEIQASGIEAVTRRFGTDVRGGPMATDCIAQLQVRFQRRATSIVARFDVPHASSDGGLVLLKALDERLRLTETMAAYLPDPRQPGKVAHSCLHLLWQRGFGLAAGYLDGNDAARLADNQLAAQAGARTRAADRTRPGLAADPLERRGPARPRPAGAPFGADSDRLPSTPAAGPDPADHARPRPDRRPDAWPAEA